MAVQVARTIREVAPTLHGAIFEQMPAEVAVLDQRGVVVAVNGLWEQAAHQDGHGESCGLGCDYLDIYRRRAADGTAQRSSIAMGLESVLQGTCGRFSVECPRSASSDDRWFLLIASPLRPHGDAAPSGAIVMHIDITSRKAQDIARLRRARVSLRRRAKRLLEVARTLRRANDELDHFAYITSHDLRAPLRGIANLSQWVEEDMGDRFTPEAHQQMELLRARVQRMESLIDAILQFARVGRAKLPPQRVDLRQLLDEVLDLLDVPGEITVHVGKDMPIIWTQPVLLQQIFMNLVGNAIKHHTPGPGNIWIDHADAGDFHRFTVRDDGPGISPNYHDKVFVMFQTLKARDEVEGTGVGLALVKKILTSCGGSIDLRSAEGRGAAFTFTWPKTRQGRNA